MTSLKPIFSGSMTVTECRINYMCDRQPMVTEWFLSEFSKFRANKLLKTGAHIVNYDVRQVYVELWLTPENHLKKVETVL